jgi:hypothetical protein
MKLERRQVLSEFMKIMKIFYIYMHDLASKEIESTFPRLKEVCCLFLFIGLRIWTLHLHVFYLYRSCNSFNILLFLWFVARMSWNLMVYLWMKISTMQLSKLWYILHFSSYSNLNFCPSLFLFLVFNSSYLKWLLLDRMIWSQK